MCLTWFEFNVQAVCRFYAMHVERQQACKTSNFGADVTTTHGSFFKYLPSSSSLHAQSRQDPKKKKLEYERPAHFQPKWSHKPDKQLTRKYSRIRPFNQKYTVYQSYVT